MGDFHRLKNLDRAQRYGRWRTSAHCLRATQMSKRANPMAVKSALTYDVSEAAKAFGKSPATIRNWVKDGLPVMSSKKPLLFSGLALREYLRAKYRAKKTPLAFDELYCPSCQTGRKPFAMTVEAFTNSPKTTRFLGTCSHCDGCSSRIISNSKASLFAQTFHVKEGEQSDA